MHANNMNLRIPHQLFINNKFIDASDGNTFDTINPNDESVSSICYYLFNCLRRNFFYLLDYVTRRSENLGFPKKKKDFA